MDSLEVFLSSKEIYFLSELLGIEVIIGLKDPYEGFTESEIQEDWLKIKDGLVEREIIFERETYQIERKHAILINAMRPESICCWFSLIEGNQQVSSHYYFTPKLVVKKSIDSNNNLFKIELVGTPKEALEEIINRFSISSSKVGSVNSYIPRSVFENILALKEKPDFDRYVMTNLNSEEKILEEFITSIKTFQKAGQFEIMTWVDHEQKWDHEDLHFIQGENGVWLTVPEMVDRVELVHIKPTTLGEFEGQLKKMIIGRLKE
ncbi:hypothetical protein DZB84_19600 [Bacillus sp. HNG]|uniref:hypothetical protein n=1 Tax=Bacillus sp. HNG TaxID=2293325 RepID=UPI000E2E8103|nr:hypothetical protein [Bacillus sp. HNG]RFB12161.1 hypothetical protein DZB84_19600 [Bacillus sp. HNG]